MKLRVSFVILASLAIVPVVYAQTIEFNQLTTTNQLGAPLPVIPYGWSFFGPFNKRTTIAQWGTDSMSNISRPIIPSIAFSVDDDKGAPRNCQNNTWNKHLGTDYVAPAGTPVYAIADGTIKRMNTYSTRADGSTVGDYYVVVESGSTNKWTTVYGHLQKPDAWPWFGGTTDMTTPIKKGDRLGVLFNFTEGGDQPHLHLGIRGAPYDKAGGINSSTRGFACLEDPNYQLNKYRFISPEQFRYYTPYYGYCSVIPKHILYIFDGSCPIIEFE